MKRSVLLSSVSALALIIAGCNADSGDNLGFNNSEVEVVDENAVTRDEAMNQSNDNTQIP